MRRIVISSAKSLFPTLSGYILHSILILEAVQAHLLISNAGNALQQVRQDAFRSTHFVKRLSYRSTVANVQGTPFWSKMGWNNYTLSTVELPPMSCILCGKNSQRLLSHLHRFFHSITSLVLFAFDRHGVYAPPVLPYTVAALRHICVEGLSLRASWS